MHDAVDWKIIDENPFCKVRTQRSTVKVNEFVPREVVDKLMKKANLVWQVILGLSRYGGLRTPSETLSRRWENIDWEMMSWHSQLPDLPGAANYPGRSVRDIQRQKQIRGRRTAASSDSQHGDGLEELEPTDRNDATLATRGRLGVATIVPLDAG